MWINTRPASLLISIRLDVFKKFDLEDIFIIVYIIIMSNLLQSLPHVA